jgi:hypothetical protein
MAIMNSDPVRVSLLCLVLALPLRGAEPAGGGLQLEVVPQTLELSSCEQSSPFLVIARNPTSQAASALEITSFSDVPVQLSPKPAAKSLPPGQQTSWQFEVKCNSDFASGYLHIVLSSRLATGGGAQLAQIATKSVAVKLRDPQTLDSLAAVDIKSTLESLTQADKGELVVTVTNKTVQPIHVSITPKTPGFIVLDPGTTGDVQVDPLRTQIFSFTATAQDRVRPGKQLLIFHVQLSSDRGKRDFIISREVNVGVLGESEILKVLGVPSLLLLPGFLAVSSFMLLWRWELFRPPGKENPPLEEKNSGFWVVSVSASLIIALAFFVIRHDFFFFYSLSDLMIVWSVSIFIGCATYVIYRATVNRQARVERAKYPHPDDTQMQTLRKLKQYGGNMAVRRVKIKGVKDPQFLLLTRDSAVYVCPEMVLTWEKGADAAVRSLVQNQLTKGGDPGIVAEAIERELDKKKTGGASGVKELKWDSADPLNPSAHKIATSDIEDSNVGEDIILREA